jgi:hypothetical protein
MFAMQTQGVRAMLATIEVIGPIILGIAGMILGYYFQRSQLKQKQREDERKEIYKKLNEFYGPIQQYLGKSRELYDRFTASRGANFRTLIALLAGEKFEGNDAVLLKQIIDIDERMEDLIITHSGLIDDAELRELLAKVGAHFRILRLAYDGVLTGEVERFEDYVYPRGLGPKIEDQIKKLKTRLDELNRM